jgi:hypothetical protein
MTPAPRRVTFPRTPSTGPASSFSASFPSAARVHGRTSTRTSTSASSHAVVLVPPRRAPAHADHDRLCGRWPPRAQAGGRAEASCRERHGHARAGAHRLGDPAQGPALLDRCVPALPARAHATDGDGAGFFTLWLWRGGSARRVVLALSGALGVIAPVDAVRLRAPRFARFYERCLGFLMRESGRSAADGWL